MARRSQQLALELVRGVVMNVSVYVKPKPPAPGQAALFVPGKDSG